MDDAPGAADESLSTEPPRDEANDETTEKGTQGVKESVANLNVKDENSSRQESHEKTHDTATVSTTKDVPLSAAATEETQAPLLSATKPSESTINTAHTAEETVDEAQLPPLSLFDPAAEEFDDVALISALQSLQVDDDDSNNQEPFDFLPLEQGEVLEELQVDPQDQELLPLADFSNVFVNEDEQVLDDNVASLEENLTSLLIDQQDPAEEIMDDDLRDENGEFPLCRPCEPGMEDPISAQFHHYQGLSEEEKLQLSLLAMADNDNNHILDADQEYNTSQEEVYEESFQTFIVSRRREAVAAAMSYTLAFGTGMYQAPREGQDPPNERICYGHKETIYSIKFSDCGRFFVSASQDATVRVWDAATHSLLSTLTGHDKDYECLRTTWAPAGWATESSSTEEEGKASFIASGGADGVVNIWLSPDPSANNSWECVSTLDHGSFQGRPKVISPRTGEVDTPQIYSLQFIEHWQGLASKDVDPNEKNSFLLTSSDDYIHLWEMDATQEVDSSEIRFSEVFSIRFTDQHNVGGGVSVCTVTSAGIKVPQEDTASSSPSQVGSSKNTFGGERNPNNIVYVFDASYCSGNGLLGVALSDSTLRLVNGRGICVSILSLPGQHSHLTSFTWDSTGSRLASCVATGHLILWGIHGEDENGRVGVSCLAVLEGGHQPGRPLFGAKYCGVDNEDLIVSWGVDGRLCLWDSQSHGQIHAPISTLISRQDYPIYAVDIFSGKNGVVSQLAVGGGLTAGFLGVPLYLYDVKRMPELNNKKEAAAASTETNE